MSMMTDQETNINGGGYGGFGGIGGGGMFPFLFGLLFGEGGLGGRRDKDCLTQSEFQSVVNNMQSSTRDQLNAMENLLGQKFATIDNMLGQDKIQVQIESLKDLFVTMNSTDRLANQASFNGIERLIAQCCCDTKSRLAEISGQIDTQTCTINNSIERSTAAELLAIERLGNANLTQYNDLRFQAQTDKCDILRAITDDGSLTRAKIDQQDKDRLERELAAATLKISQIEQTSTILHHPGYREKSTSPDIDINVIGSLVQQAVSGIANDVAALKARA